MFFITLYLLHFYPEVRLCGARGSISCVTAAHRDSLGAALLTPTTLTSPPDSEWCVRAQGAQYHDLLWWSCVLCSPVMFIKQLFSVVHLHVMPRAPIPPAQM